MLWIQFLILSGVVNCVTLCHVFSIFWFIVRKVYDISALLWRNWNQNVTDRLSDKVTYWVKKGDYHFTLQSFVWELTIATYESDRNQDAGKESVRANCPAHQQALCAIELHCVSRAFSCRVSPSLSTTTACRSVRWTCDIAKVASSASCQIISSNSKRKGEKEAESIKPTIFLIFNGFL